MSSLPFLKKKNVGAGVITEYRKPSGNIQESSDSENDNSDAPLSACAQDLINGIHNKDQAAVSKALRAAFEILDSEPHEEGPHTNEDNESE